MIGSLCTAVPVPLWAGLLDALWPASRRATYSPFTAVFLQVMVGWEVSSWVIQVSGSVWKPAAATE